MHRRVMSGYYEILYIIICYQNRYQKVFSTSSFYIDNINDTRVV